MTPPHRTAATIVAVATLWTVTACAPAEPDPQAYWDDLSFYAGVDEDQRDEALETGRLVCADLTALRTEDDADAATALWRSWVEDAGRDDADFLFRTAVEHLCPENGGPLDEVRDGDASSAGTDATDS